MIPAAAMKLGRPVKWQEDRREHFSRLDAGARSVLDRSPSRSTRDGKILGLRGTMLHDTGAYRAVGHHRAVSSRRRRFPAPTWCRPTRSNCTVVLTNRVPTTVVRGAGRPQAVFAMERLMDRVARELKLDRAEVRARNMIQPEQMPYSVGLMFRDGKPLVYASGDFPKSQTPRARALELRRLPRAAGQGARRGPLPRHRHRQLRRRHRARPVRGRHHPRHAERQGRGRDRRHRRRDRARARRCRRSSPTMSAAGSRTS